MNQTQYEAREKFINTIATMAHDARMSDEQIVKTFWAVWAKPEYANLDLLPAINNAWDRLFLAIEKRTNELNSEVVTCEWQPATLEANYTTRQQIMRMNVTTKTGYRISCALMGTNAYRPNVTPHIEITVWAPEDADIVETSDELYDLDSAKAWRDAAYRKYSK